MNPRASLRRVIYLLERGLQTWRFRALAEPPERWPTLLGISFPKSGTHLLDQILLGFSRVAPVSRRLHSFYAEYEGDTGHSRRPEDAAEWLRSLRPRDVASAHLFARPDVVARVASRAFFPLFIFRDPRDVVVSHAFYVADIEQRHVHHDYYASLPDFDSRLHVSILGRPELEIDFPNIAMRFEPYMAWLDCPEVMKIHFEDLVERRPKILDAIIDRFLARVPLASPRPTIRRALESSIDPAKSPTFRAGRVGDWKRYFKPEHKERFKSVAGTLLQRLGYEPSNDW